jgi:hypothetical protein
MTTRKAKKLRLERAGFVHLSGWVLAEDDRGLDFCLAIEKYRPEVQRIAAEPPKPRGRPPKLSAQRPWAKSYGEA